MLKPAFMFGAGVILNFVAFVRTTKPFKVSNSPASPDELPFSYSMYFFPFTFAVHNHAERETTDYKDEPGKRNFTHDATDVSNEICHC